MTFYFSYTPLTGEVLASAVKAGVGETLTNDKEKLTLEKVKPLLDSWIETLEKTLKDNL